ncbi:MAG: hypothetical protein J6O55_07635 [Lachnospiraceae bacterium]|nr:hypothetical protein [Lachnospiraceae bacterium]
MKIAESNVSMAASNEYQRYGRKGLKSSGGLFSANGKDGSSKKGSSMEDSFTMENNLDMSFFQATYQKKGENSRNVEEISTVSNIFKEGTEFRDVLLELIFRRLGRLGLFGGMWSNSSYGSLSAPTINAGMNSWTEVSYYEKEATEFSAEGKVRTEDGREIDFSLGLAMSRELMEYANVQPPLVAAALTDPLVIHTGTLLPNLSDQKFFFDLDCDGNEEEISTLGAGSGFLALDKNGDGKINDGSELFGVKSGDGFGDLRKYDSDGNGWIDENDDIYNKLKVWYKNEDGTDELLDLKKADVGAIYLGEQATDFSLYGAAGQLNGQLRSTGFFLKESGGAGLVQHIDLATGDIKKTASPSAANSTENAPDPVTMGYAISRKTGTDVLEERRRSQERLRAKLNRRAQEKKTERKRLQKKYEDRRLEEKERLELLFIDKESYQ